MAPPAQRFGIVGLGRIGGGLARLALASGFSVVGHDRAGAAASLVEAGLEPAADPAALAAALRPPRIVFLYVPAGLAVDQVVGRLVPALTRGDVVVDGGNSYWRDSRARQARL